MSQVRRGDVVTVAAGGGMGYKPRPAIVVQNDAYSQSDTIVVIPLTRETSGELVTRPVFEPDERNGLQEPSRLMTNRLAGMPLANVGRVFGKMSAGDMERVDAALILLLGLDGS